MKRKHKYSKRILAFILAIAVLVPLFSGTPTYAEDSKKMRVGQTITLGSYNGEPIVWKCVEIDDNGPLMYSEKILCFKAFDASGESSEYHSDGWGYIRKTWGSSCWSDSSLRTWLNSDDISVSYSHCPPSANNIYHGDGYDKEAGFLTNFTDAEKQCIKKVTNKMNINAWETTRKGYCDGGFSELPFIDRPSAITNTDYSRYYYQNVTDMMFLPNAAQLYKIMNNFSDWEIVYPTEGAVQNYSHKDPAISPDKPWCFWTTVPTTQGASYENVRAFGHWEAGNGGYFNDGSQKASKGFYGVRPAFYLNEDNYYKNIGNSNTKMPTDADKEVLEKAKLFTSNEGKSYSEELNNLKDTVTYYHSTSDEIEQAYFNFFVHLNMDNEKEGVTYFSDSPTERQAYDYLTCGDCFMSERYAKWLDSDDSTFARMTLETSDIIFNNEIKEDIEGAITQGETSDVKKYETILIKFLQDATDSITNESYIDSLDKTIDIFNNIKTASSSTGGVVDVFNKDVLEHFEEELDKSNSVEESDRIWEKYFSPGKLTAVVKNPDSIYEDGYANFHFELQDYSDVKAATNYTEKGISCISSVNDIVQFYYKMSKLNANCATLNYSIRILNQIIDGEKYLPWDMVQAAKYVKDDVYAPFQETITEALNQVFLKTIEMETDYTKKYVPLANIISMGFENVGITNAIEVVKLGALIVNATTGVGSVVKDAAYAEGYGYLEHYYSEVILPISKEKFLNDESIENAWDFYDNYQTLYNLRVNGENAYLNLLKESAFTVLLKNVKSYLTKTDSSIDIAKRFAEDSFKYMEKYCRFDIDNAKDSNIYPSAQKAIIKCPVNVEVYDGENLVYTIYDKREDDTTNEYGRFVCYYDAASDDWVKIAYLSDDKNYVIKTIGTDSGNVDISTTVKDGDKANIYKITGLPIEENGSVSVDTSSLNYVVDQNGDNESDFSGTMSDVTIDKSQPTSIKMISREMVNNSDKSIVLEEGETAAIGITLDSNNFSSKNVIWNSDDNNVATVDCGKVVALKKGKTTVTVTYKDLSDTCTISVKAKHNSSTDSSNPDKTGETDGLSFDSTGGNSSGSTGGSTSGSSSDITGGNSGASSADSTGGSTPSSTGGTSGSNVSDAGNNSGSNSGTDAGNSGETDTGNGNVTDNSTDTGSDEDVAVKMGSQIKDAKTKATYKVLSKIKVAYVKPSNMKSKSVTVPATITYNGVKYKVTEIAANAFKNDKMLEKITVGKNIVKINKNAFYGCTKLKKVIFKTSTLKSVSKTAFRKCSNLRIVSLLKKNYAKQKNIVKAALAVSGLKKYKVSKVKN